MAKTQINSKTSQYEKKQPTVSKQCASAQRERSPNF